MQITVGLTLNQYKDLYLWKQETAFGGEFSGLPHYDFG